MQIAISPLTRDEATPWCKLPFRIIVLQKLRGQLIVANPAGFGLIRPELFGRFTDSCNAQDATVFMPCASGGEFRDRSCEIAKCVGKLCTAIQKQLANGIQNACRDDGWAAQIQ